MNTTSAYRLVGALLVLVACSMPIAAFSVSSPEGTSAGQPPPVIPKHPADMVDERPGTVTQLWDYATAPVVWTWGILRDHVFSWMAPPSPASITDAVSEKDVNQLFKFLGDAGYKLKDIHTDVGVIPGLTFEFRKVRELSEADYEVIESEVAEWESKNPGIYASLQRKIIRNIIRINSGIDYEVSSLKVEVLPLPDVSFEMTPKGDTDEKDALMRAVNRLERTVQTLPKTNKN